MKFASEGGDREILSLVAAADLRTKQYYGVKTDANGDVILCSAAGEFCLGVLQNKPNTGERADVCVHGLTPMVGGAAINEGDPVAIAATGKAKVAARLVQASGNGSQVMGRAISACGADLEQFTVFVDREGVIPTADA